MFFFVVIFQPFFWEFIISFFTCYINFCQELIVKQSFCHDTITKHRKFSDINTFRNAVGNFLSSKFCRLVIFKCSTGFSISSFNLCQSVNMAVSGINKGQYVTYKKISEIPVLKTLKNMVGNDFLLGINSWMMNFKLVRMCYFDINIILVQVLYMVNNIVFFSPPHIFYCNFPQHQEGK